MEASQSVIRRSPPHLTSTIQRGRRTHTRLPEPTSVSERARPSGSTGERPTLIGRPATNLQRCRPTPGAPAKPPGGARLGLKTSPDQAPPAPPARHPWEAEGRGAHNDPSLAGRELGDNRHMHARKAKERLKATNRSLHPPRSLQANVQRLRAPQEALRFRHDRLLARARCPPWRWCRCPRRW